MANKRFKYRYLSEHATVDCPQPICAERKNTREQCKSVSQSKKRRVHSIAISIIFFLGAAIYLNALPGQFIWDDEYLVEKNMHIQQPRNMFRLFSEDIGVGSGEDKKYNSYRPVQMITYLVDYAVWKLNPFGYHLTNVLIHIACAVALYALAWLLAGSFFVSFSAALLFVTQPIHTEAVTYISGRADPLMGLFLLSSLIAYVLSAKKRSFDWFSGLAPFLFVLAVLSKEHALILPVLILLYHVSFRERIIWKRYVWFPAIVILYILLRLSVLAHILYDGPSDSAMWERIPGFFVALLTYVKLLFSPVHLHMEYGNGFFEWTDMRVWGGVGVLLFLLIVLVIRRKSKGWVYFGLLWFLLALLPVSNIYTINAYMAEHWLYLPCMGFYLLCGYELSQLKNRSKTVAISILLSVVIFFSVLTVIQNSYWRHHVPFYLRTLRYAPDSMRVYYNLGNIYKDTRDFDQALKYYQKALSIDPHSPEVNNNLAIIYAEIGMPEQAIIIYQKAIERNPNDPRAYYNLGKIYQQFGRSDDARSLYEQSLNLDARQPDCLNNLGIIYMNEGRFEEARVLYGKALSLNPEFIMARENLMILERKTLEPASNINELKERIAKDSTDVSAYKELARAFNNSPEQSEAALWVLKEMLANNSAYAEGWYLLGNQLSDMRRVDEAIVAYEKALSLNDSLDDAMSNVGAMYALKGNQDKAKTYYEKALMRNPKNVGALHNMSVMCYAQGQFELARKYAQQASQLGHQLPEAFLRDLERAPIKVK